MKDFFTDEMLAYYLQRWATPTKWVVSILMLGWTYFYMNTPTSELNSTYKWLNIIMPDPIWAAPAWFIWLAYDAGKRRKKNDEQPEQKATRWAKVAGFTVLAIIVGVPLLTLALILVMCLFGMCISV